MTSGPAGRSGTAAAPAPSPLVRAAWVLLGLQALGLVALAVVVLVHAAAGDRSRGVRDQHLSMQLLVSAGIACLVVALLYVLALRSLRLGARWPRSLVVLLEILTVVVSTGLAQAGQYGYAVLVGVPALVIALGVLAQARADGAPPA